MIKISAVIITLNEEKNIERCLKSLLGVVDEIVVMDSGSTDQTEEICNQFDVRFIKQDWLGYGAQKNLANSLTQHDYILSLDADEALSEELKQSILKAKTQHTVDAYTMNRCTHYGDRWIKHSGWYPDRKLRLWKKEKANWSLEKVHERVIIASDTVVRHLKGDILHYTYDSIEEHIATNNKYAIYVAEEYFKDGRKVSFWMIFFAPAWTFIRDYFFKLGILDGYYGYVICRVSANYTFLKYAKLQELYQHTKKPAVSLIVTTYNRVDALEAVLRSILKQSILPVEVIVADDGSTSETKELVQKISSIFPIPLHHCWQEDKGFRVAAIRNKAMAKAISDYIVMIDGDIVLHKHFIRNHKQVASRGKFVQGRRALLSEELTRQFLFGKKKWVNWWSHGVKNKLNAIEIRTLSPVMSTLLSKQKHTSIRSCNMACWKSDILAINGFNEAFEGWGREDSEFAVRLFNNGIRRKDLRFGGVGYHLYHHENPRTALEKNELLLQNTIDQRLSFCDLGINQHLQT
jgi:glycosyltransferase involved in cell wall biosynthesis